MLVGSGVAEEDIRRGILRIRISFGVLLRFGKESPLSLKYPRGRSGL
jgi:hypothetical protein